MQPNRRQARPEGSRSSKPANPQLDLDAIFIPCRCATAEMFAPAAPRRGNQLLLSIALFRRVSAMIE